MTGSEAKHAGGDRTGRTVPVTLHVTSAYIHCVLRRLSGRLSGKESTHQAGDMVPSLGWEDSLEKEMATQSTIHAWKILWTEEPSGL